LRMTITTGSAAVMDALPMLTIIHDGGMGSVILREPIERGVAGSAIRAEHSGVESRISMAAGACGWQPFKLTRCMTFLTGHQRMYTCQRETAFAVIEGNFIPRRSLMAGCAICAKLAVVVIILLMARDTSRGRTLVHIVDVALFAFDAGMCAAQFERSEIVIELGGLPAIGRVAGSTIRTEPSLVCVVLLMAGFAILWNGLQVCHRARVYMTLQTIHGGMFTCQFEV